MTYFWICGRIAVGLLFTVCLSGTHTVAAQTPAAEDLIYQLRMVVSHDYEGEVEWDYSRILKKPDNTTEPLQRSGHSIGTGKYYSETLKWVDGAERGREAKNVYTGIGALVTGQPSDQIEISSNDSGWGEVASPGRLLWMITGRLRADLTHVQVVSNGPDKMIVLVRIANETMHLVYSPGQDLPSEIQFTGDHPYILKLEWMSDRFGQRYPSRIEQIMEGVTTDLRITRKLEPRLVLLSELKFPISHGMLVLDNRVQPALAYRVATADEATFRPVIAEPHELQKVLQEK